jgi:multiple RNA-binding domain-containing protein 1
MNPNAVIESVCKKFHIKKAQILSPEGENMAVKIAQMEAQIVNETITWLS